MICFGKLVALSACRNGCIVAIVDSLYLPKMGPFYVGHQELKANVCQVNNCADRLCFIDWASCYNENKFCEIFLGRGENFCSVHR